MRGDPRELDDLAAGRHVYAELLVLGRPLVLCAFCQADFSSYAPSYFHRPFGTRLGLGEFKFLHEVPHPRRGKDKFCPGCNHRLAFLEWLAAVRADVDAAAT